MSCFSLAICTWERWVCSNRAAAASPCISRAAGEAAWQLQVPGKMRHSAGAACAERLLPWTTVIKLHCINPPAATNCVSALGLKYRSLSHLAQTTLLRALLSFAENRFILSDLWFWKCTEHAVLPKFLSLYAHGKPRVAGLALTSYAETLNSTRLG